MSAGGEAHLGAWLLCLTMALTTTSCRAAAPSAERHQVDRDRPALALLTALPIVFGEGFGLDAPASPVLNALSKSYRMRPIDGPEELPEGGLLLAAQPRALTAERLVAMDGWVRRGGHLLLLADPHLDWLSDQPLEDKFRPPFSFDDTGLLLHWGLRLSYERGPPQQRSLGRRSLAVTSAGVLTSDGRTCLITDGGWRADCQVGKGRAIVIADADWIDARQWPTSDKELEQLGALTDQLALLTP